MQTATDAAAILVGVALIGLTLSDVFQSVIVPRAVGRRFRFSFILWDVLWKIWPALSWRVYPRDDDAREDFLAFFAPLSLVLMLVLWAVVMLLGYGCIFWALRYHIRPVPQTYWQSVYFAGSAFFTIGFGDFVGTSGMTRVLSLIAGASGFGVVSVTTAYLFAIFGFFQAREAFVVTVGAQAGSPPSGVGLLTMAPFDEIESDLPNVMRAGQAWTAVLMESHLAYPTIAYFRSSHDYESWVGTLGTLLDASILMMTALECSVGQARIMYNLGRHATRDLGKHFRARGANRSPGITRAEFDTACERLRQTGATVRSNDETWNEFARLRSTYASDLDALAHHFEIPPLQWVGDRSMIATQHLLDQNP